MSSYPYTGQLSANVGGGLGGLPVRRSLQLSTDINGNIEVRNQYNTVVTKAAGSPGKFSCIELDDESILAATLTATSNIAIKRYKNSINATLHDQSTDFIGSVLNVGVTTAASALLLKISSTKTLLVTRSNSVITAWNIDTSATTPTIGSPITAASNHIPLSIVSCGVGKALVLCSSVGTTTLTAWLVDANSSTPTLTALSISGSPLTLYTTDDTADTLRLVQLNDSNFIIKQSGSVNTLSAQGISLSGTTITFTSKLTILTNYLSGSAHGMICRISDTTALLFGKSYQPTATSIACVLTFDGATITKSTSVDIALSYDYVNSLGSLIDISNGYFLLISMYGSADMVCAILQVKNNVVSFKSIALRTHLSNGGINNFYFATPSNNKKNKFYFIGDYANVYSPGSVVIT